MTVRAAIDRFKNGSGGAPRDLLARAGSLPPDTQIWAKFPVGEEPPRTSFDSSESCNFDCVLRAVDGANLTVDLHSGAHAALTGDCRTEADAKNLADSRGLAALARMGNSRVFDGIQVNETGRIVKVNLDVPEDRLEKLIRLWH